MRKITTYKSYLIGLLLVLIGFLWGAKSEVYASSVEEVSVNVKYQQTSARSMLSLINQFRTGSDAWVYDSNENKVYYNDLKPLAYDYELEQVAMQRAAEITLYYSHTRPNLEPFYTAFDEQYLGYSLASENIAAGYNRYPTAESVFNAWKEDNASYANQGHRRNMLNKDFTAVGIAHVYYNGCHFWVQEFRNPAGTITETTAINSKKSVKVSLNMKDVSVTLMPTVSSIGVAKGQKENLPKIEIGVKTPQSWPAEFDYFYADSNISWSVSNTKIIKVEDGKLVGVGKGDAKLIASALGKKVEIPVHVGLVAADNGKLIQGVESIALSYTSHKYTGSQLKPTPTILAENGSTLVKGTDYTVSYGTNTNIGIGTVIIKFKGKYSGTKTVEFIINPAPMENITVASNGYNSVKLSWKKGLNGAGYRIYRATSKTGTYKWIATVGKNATLSYVDTDLTCGKTYYYKLRAYRTVNGTKYYSTYSSIKSAKPVPAKPTIKLTNVSTKSVKVSWSKISGASGYQVYRATKKTGTYSKVYTVTQGKTISAKNAKMVKGKTYYYKVRAYRTVNGTKVYGPFSAIKSIKIVR